MLVINTGFVTGVGSLAISPCGGWLVAAPRWDSLLADSPSAPSNFNLRYWRLPTPDSRVRSVKCLAPKGIHFLGSGGLLILDEKVDGLTSRPFPSGTPVHVLLPGDTLPECSTSRIEAVSKDGQFVIVSKAHWLGRTRKMQLWDAVEVSEVELPKRAFSYERCPARHSVFHPKGDRLLSFYQNIGMYPNLPRAFLVMFGFPAGEVEQVVELKGSFPDRLVFSPDTRFVASVDKNACSIRNADTLSEIASLRPAHDASAWNYASNCLWPLFTPDSRFFTLGCYDGKVRMYDARNWTEARVYDWGTPLVGDEERKRGAAVVSHVAFTPDGAMGIAAVGNNIVIWDME